MNLNEAKTAYIESKNSYKAVIGSYDRSANGARQARFAAYNEMKQAQIDLIDVFADVLENAEGINGELNSCLGVIMSDAKARDDVCELALSFMLC